MSTKPRKKPEELRSQQWFGRQDRDGFAYRSWVKGKGVPHDQFDGRPVIGIFPFALIGGIFALLISGIPLSVSAAIGFIALFGQAVLNGVVMVSYFNQLKQQKLETYQVVFQGALSRLRTVLMTALLAMLGLLPMALSHGIGSETQRPLALVVMGGLISATLLTLFVLPALYYYVATHPRLAKALH